jgi:predicted component of type VI protein secretion system
MECRECEKFVCNGCIGSECEACGSDGVCITCSENHLKTCPERSPSEGIVLYEQLAIKKYEDKIKQAETEFSSIKSHLKQLKENLAQSKKRKAEAELLQASLTHCKKRKAKAELVQKTVDMAPGEVSA